MAQFDDLVAKYRNLSYGRLAGTNPSAVNSLLNAQDRGTNSITSPNYFGNIPIEQQQYLDTPSGFIGQNQFRIDPNTGIPVFETPTTEAINQGIEMGGGTVGSGVYDQNVDYGDEGYAGVTPVDPVTGLVGTTTQQRERGSNAQDANQAARDLAMQDRYTRNDDGSITQYDASTKKTTNYNLTDEGLTFPQKFFGNVTNVPTVSSLLEDAYDGVKNYFSPDKGPLGGEVTAQDFNAATGGSKPGSLGSYDRTKDTAFGDGNKPTGLNKSFTPDPKVTKEVNLSLNKTADPLSLPAGRFKGNDRPSRGVRSEGVAGGGNKDKGSAGGSVNTGGGGFGGRW